MSFTTTVAPARASTREMPPPMPAPPPVTNATLPFRSTLSLLDIKTLAQEPHGPALHPVAPQLAAGDAPFAAFALIVVVITQRPRVISELSVVLVDVVG